MTFNFIEYLLVHFGKLIEKYGFERQNEINDGQSYSVEYRSNVFVIKIEKYRREFYVTLSKIGAEKAINLFNLLDYLIKDSKDAPKSEYFSSEENFEESYRKQLDHLSTVIYTNMDLIKDFFSSENYEVKVDEIDKYMQDRYPWLFKRD